MQVLLGARYQGVLLHCGVPRAHMVLMLTSATSNPEMIMYTAAPTMPMLLGTKPAPCRRGEDELSPEFGPNTFAKPAAANCVQACPAQLESSTCSPVHVIAYWAGMIGGGTCVVYGRARMPAPTVVPATRAAAPKTEPGWCASV